MNRTSKDELPRELVPSIQRILDHDDGSESDPLDSLVDFDPVMVLNQYFPDGLPFHLYVAFFKLRQTNRGFFRTVGGCII